MTEDLNEKFAQAREILTLMNEGEDFASKSEAEVLEALLDHLTEMQIATWMLDTAIRYQLTPDETEQWITLARDRLDKLGEGEELSDEMLEKLIAEVRTEQ